jgi:DNA-binding XRE family transcriptional regulator
MLRELNRVKSMSKQKTKLGELLAKSNKTRHDLASKIGVDEDTVTRWSNYDDNGNPKLRFHMDRLDDLIAIFNDWTPLRTITADDLIEDNVYFLNELLVIGQIDKGNVLPLMEHYKIVPPWKISAAHHAYIEPLNADSNAYYVVNNKSKYEPDSRIIINSQCVLHFKDIQKSAIVCANLDRLRDKLEITSFIAHTEDYNQLGLNILSIDQKDVSYIEVIVGVIYGNYNIID